MRFIKTGVTNVDNMDVALDSVPTSGSTVQESEDGIAHGNVSDNWTCLEKIKYLAKDAPMDIRKYSGGK